MVEKTQRQTNQRIGITIFYVAYIVDSKMEACKKKIELLSNFEAKTYALKMISNINI